MPDKGSMDDEVCLRCGQIEAHQCHDRRNPPEEGWHIFRGQSYLDDLEDALLFAQEHPTPHIWRENGMIVLTNPGFPEKSCEACGTINWGGNEGGICGGNVSVPSAQVAAHNRRAYRHLDSHISDLEPVAEGEK